MADKVYVHVGKFGIKSINDNVPGKDKVKKVALAAMKKATEKALGKSGVLTLAAPKEKDEPAVHVDGSLAALGLVEKDGQKLLVCKVSLVAGEWILKSKKGKMSLFPSGGGKVPVEKPENAAAVASDTAWLLDSVVSDLVEKQLLKPLEAKAKGLAKAKKAKK